MISYGRAMIGATDPLKAVPGTIRGDYGVDGGRNLIVSLKISFVLSDAVTWTMQSVFDVLIPLTPCTYLCSMALIPLR